MLYQLSWYHPAALYAGELITREKSIIDELMRRRLDEGCQVWLETLSGKLAAAMEEMKLTQLGKG